MKKQKLKSKFITSFLSVATLTFAMASSVNALSVSAAYVPYLLDSKATIDSGAHLSTMGPGEYVAPTGYNIGVTSLKQNMAQIPYYMSDFVRAESQKFPNNMYWNSSNNNSYTSTPTPSGNTSNCSRYSVDFVAYDCYYAENFNNGSLFYNYYMKNYKGYQTIQSNGFARKLSSDYFQTDSFVDVSIKNVGNKIRYTESNDLYVPRIGDHIRFKDGSGYDIWIYSVNGNTVTYADCNSDGHCKIRWSQTANINRDGYTFSSCGHTVVDYVERPLAVGDVNGDSFVDAEDQDYLFQIRSTLGNTPIEYWNVPQRDYVFAACDINRDGVLNICDPSTLSLIMSGELQAGYLKDIN